MKQILALLIACTVLGAEPPVAPVSPPALRMLVPGFTVRELPVKLTSLNNIEYAPDGRLFAGGYDGRFHLLRDTDGDGLEDTVDTFSPESSANYPLGMAVKDGEPYAVLTDEVVSGGTSGSLGYAYDSVGNRTNRTGSLGALGAVTSSYNTNDWLTGDIYDNNGNTRTNASSQPYFYDVQNRLTNFNNGAVIITYNADGNRVKKVAGGVTTLYLVDMRNLSGYAQVLEELTVSGGTTNLAKAYSYGLDLISQRVPNTSTNFFGYDG